MFGCDVLTDSVSVGLRSVWEYRGSKTPWLAGVVPSTQRAKHRCRGIVSRLQVSRSQ